MSVCPIGILTVTHQGAACDVASIYFGPTIMRTDGLLFYVFVSSVAVCCESCVCQLIINKDDDDDDDDEDDDDEGACRVRWHDRVISRAPGLKLVVQTLLSSLRPIGNIVLICCTFFIIFGILGLQVNNYDLIDLSQWRTQADARSPVLCLRIWRHEMHSVLK